MHLADVKELAQNFNNNPKLSDIRIETLGCRLNQIESESVAHYLIKSNFSVQMEGVTAKTPSDSKTKLCIVNTCTVTQKAEQKARRIIRLLLKKFPNAIILVTGCYAQLSTKEIEKIDKRICVLPGQLKSRLADLPKILSPVELVETNEPVETITQIKENIINPPQEKPGYPEDSFKLSTSSFLVHSRASLKIQDGCNNACSYCAIHMARGHSVSIDVETAVKRVQELEAAGQNEVVITSINIAQYRGKYKDEYYNFAKLLQKMLDSTKNISFRISSLYPEIVDEEFCRVISNNRVRPHFHISVQSGSNKILKLMNRVYTSEDVIKACQNLRKAKPNSFLACDIITGFPCETEDDFSQTMHLCNSCQFAWVHAFPYSERPGTPAATMKNKVPQSISGERAKKLTQWAINQKIEYINSFVGKEVNGIVETSNHCMTENFIHCEIKSDIPLEENKEYLFKIISPLPEKILKGGEIEAVAQPLKNC